MIEITINLYIVGGILAGIGLYSLAVWLVSKLAKYLGQ
jgi:hypothetical protein